MKTLLLLLPLVTALSWAGSLNIYFLRHAEGGHNVTDKFAKVPKAEWPKYVGNPDMFTPEGEKQVAAVPGLLKGIPVDAVICSPLWRCQHTVLPFLKERGLTAEFWPELVEGKPGTNLAMLRKEMYEAVGTIKVTEDAKAFFTYRADSGTGEWKPQSEAETIAYANRVKERIVKTWGGKDKTLLIAGHSFAGAYLLRAFTGDAKWQGRDLKNASLTRLVEQADGSWKVVLLSGEPL